MYPVSCAGDVDRIRQTDGQTERSRRDQLFLFRRNRFGTARVGRITTSLNLKAHFYSLSNPLVRFRYSRSVLFQLHGEISCLILRVPFFPELTSPGYRKLSVFNFRVVSRNFNSFYFGTEHKHWLFCLKITFKTIILKINIFRYIRLGA